jgi:integrative and conjugative element protein (TIGR02256 family)
MENEWVIEVDGFGLIRISKELIVRLLTYRQIQDDALESGGVLVGKYLNSNGIILIDNYTPPQPSDKQGRYEYYRSSDHTRLVQKIWQDSRHQSTYVGLWHTHAEPIPNYSSVDKKDWMIALNRSVYEGSTLFYFIVGQTHIRCWMGTKRAFINKIELIGEYHANME